VLEFVTFVRGSAAELIRACTVTTAWNGAAVRVALITRARMQPGVVDAVTAEHLGRIGASNGVELIRERLGGRLRACKRDALVRSPDDARDLVAVAVKADAGERDTLVGTVCPVKIAGRISDTGSPRTVRAPLGRFRTPVSPKERLPPALGAKSRAYPRLSAILVSAPKRLPRARIRIVPARYRIASLGFGSTALATARRPK
jgi:hypothetical protein